MWKARTPQLPTGEGKTPGISLWAALSILAAEGQHLLRKKETGTGAAPRFYACLTSRKVTGDVTCSLEPICHLHDKMSYKGEFSVRLASQPVLPLGNVCLQLFIMKMNCNCLKC